MKIKTINIALKGTRNGEVVGGFIVKLSTPSGAIVFCRKEVEISVRGKRTGCPYGVMAEAALNMTLIHKRKELISTL